MGEKINIELEERKLEKLEAIARLTSEKSGREVSVEELIGNAIDGHLARLSKELKIAF